MTGTSAEVADILAEMIETAPPGFVPVYLPTNGTMWFTNAKLFPSDVRAASGTVDVTADLVAELRAARPSPS